MLPGLEVKVAPVVPSARMRAFLLRLCDDLGFTVVIGKEMEIFHGSFAKKKVSAKTSPQHLLQPEGGLACFSI
jgi:hypothetical protein